MYVMLQKSLCHNFFKSVNHLSSGFENELKLGTN
jgi:hypothetical protein